MDAEVFGISSRRERRKAYAAIRSKISCRAAPLVPGHFDINARLRYRLDRAARGHAEFLLGARPAGGYQTVRDFAGGSISMDTKADPYDPFRSKR